MLREISELGGVVGVLTNHGTLRNQKKNDCPTSSTSVASALSYAARETGTAGVGLGTDFNGLPG